MVTAGSAEGVDETAARRVALVTLGCARNDVDSEELAGRLTADGWELVGDGSGSGGDGGDPDVVLVNTCGFIDSAKKDSIDTLLAAADTGAKVVAVGCLAQRYGEQLAAELPEADAVLGFDHYPALGDRLRDIVAGRAVPSHVPADRRALLPISPAERPAARPATPGHADRPAGPSTGAADLPAGVAPPSGPRVLRRRLDDAPVAPLKLASGCDRRCAFCAIPSFRGSFVSRPPEEVLAEADWLAAHGVRELVLVSENSTSYGKDLPGGLGALEALLPRLATVPGIDRVRVSYLQPAETRPALVAAIAGTPGVASYFDLSFQHAGAAVLRRMRRFGSTEAFLGLLEQIRLADPAAGARSNVILGFPGERPEDVAELERFLTAARLDAIGVFGYSDEDGTEAAGLSGKIDPGEIVERVAKISDLAERLTAQRAAERIGSGVDVLIETAASADDDCLGRAAHQAPEVDGECVLADGDGLAVGDLVRCVVVDAEGVDLVVEPREVLPREPR